MTTTTAQKRASIKWQRENYKRIPFDVRPELYDQIKAHCSKNGETVGGYLKRLILADLEGSGARLSELIPAELYADFMTVIHSENGDLSTIMTNAITRYVERHTRKDSD